MVVSDRMCLSHLSFLLFNCPKYMFKKVVKNVTLHV